MADPDLLIAGLEECDREALRRWSSRILGDPGAWARVSMFRALVETLALCTVSDRLRELDPTTSPRAAWLQAGELCLGDDDDRGTAPADVAARRLRRWLAAARTKCPSRVQATVVRSAADSKGDS